MAPAVPAQSQAEEGHRRQLDELKVLSSPRPSPPREEREFCARHARALALLIGLLPSLALADAAFITSRGRVATALQFDAFAGTDTLGLGVVSPDTPRAAFGVELAYRFNDQSLEARAARAWQLTTLGFATASVTLGGTVHLVPDVTDAGLGPHAGLHLSLGGQVFTVDLSLLGGAEVFAHGPLLRFPLRAAAGLRLCVPVAGGALAFGAQARMGADVLLNGFVGRGELVGTLSWSPSFAW
ncbi:MAG: hypothetical protein U0228_10380 [Myxococcaceae bacterium]